MNKRRSLLSLILFLAVLVVPAASPSFGQDRFFDSAPVGHEGTRLVVFHPTVNKIKDLQALRTEKLLDIEDLTVIGVFHRKEVTDYEPSKAYVLEQHLDWLKFHALEATAGPSELYQKNALTPEFEKIFAASDGVIFFGGPDIPPSLYGGKTSLLTIIEDPCRHYFELSALFHLLGESQDESFKPLLDSRPDYPVLAICLGAQSLNVATGGTLVQDIWNEVYGKMFLEDVLGLGPENWHTNPNARLYPHLDLTGITLQPIALIEGGALRRMLAWSGNGKPCVLSSHHQAMAKLGRGLKVEATSLDGRVVEAVSHERFPNVLGVQFHPESASLWDPAMPYRLRPDEIEAQTWKGFLEAHPPSLEFHRKLWAWFASALKSHGQK